MTSQPILNPPIPYVGAVEGGLVPGKMVKVQGKVPTDAVRFAVNYQLGPTLNPRDDIAIHVSPRFPEGFITRNHIESMTWGAEENTGPMWIQPGQEFEILLLCDHTCYKIAINGRHFAEFVHRLPYQKVTHLVIDGDVEVQSISYETVGIDPPSSSRPVSAPDVPVANFGPPPPGGLYPTIGPGGYGPPPPGPGYGPPPSGPGYGPPPPGPGYGPPPPVNAYGVPGYNPPRPYEYQPGYEKPEEQDVFGACSDKVGLAIGGLVGLGGLAAYALNKKKDETEESREKSDASKSKTESEGGLKNHESLCAALANSLVSNVLSNSQAQQGYPPQQSSGSGGSGGGVFGSILATLGGRGDSNAAAPLPSLLVGAVESVIGGAFGGTGNQQPNSGSNMTIDSSSNNFTLGSLTKQSKDRNHEGNRSVPPTNIPNFPPPIQPPISSDGSAATGHKLTADEISKGLGLDD